MKDNNPLQQNALNFMQGVIIFSLDNEYCYTAFTESHQRVMNQLWGANIKLGQNMLAYILREDDRQKAKENFDKTLQGEQLILEEEYGDDTGFVRTWWENRYSPIFNEEGKVAGLTIFVLDITRLKQIEKALRISEINYRSIMDQAGDGIFISDPEGKYLDVNHVGCEMLGYSRDEILSMTMQDLIRHPKQLRFDTLNNKGSVIVERELKAKDGRLIPVEISGKVMEDGRLIGLVRDISIRRQEEARIRYLAFVMDHISSAVISTDHNLKITHWNKGAEILYGWTEQEALGQLIDQICGTEFLPEQQEFAQTMLLKTGGWSGEVSQKHRNGHKLWVEVSVTLMRDEFGEYVGGVTINHDITERKQAEVEIRRAKDDIDAINLTLRRAFEREQLASRTDGLTGIYNRRFFFELLEYEFSGSKRYQRPLSLVMYDVDFLKQVNDTYGHQMGDALLKKITEIVHAELREADVLARYGGDEFVILLPNSTEADTHKLFERIHTQLKNAFLQAGRKKIKLSVSVGIASLKNDMEKADQLVQQADQALYAAKNSGRNRLVVFSH